MIVASFQNSKSIVHPSSCSKEKTISSKLVKGSLDRANLQKKFQSASRKSVPAVLSGYKKIYRRQRNTSSSSFITCCIGDCNGGSSAPSEESVVSLCAKQMKTATSKFFSGLSNIVWGESSTSGMNKSGPGLGLLAAAALVPGNIGSGFSEVLNNQVFMSAFYSWALAQALKVPTYFISTGKWRLKAMVDAGGMPSSHSSLCMGFTTAIAILHGLSSSLFPVCLGFSLIVMYDAAGVRRHAGKQAEAINKLKTELYQGILKKDISECGPLLKEVLGHTPIQVFAGAVLGVVTAIIYSTLV